MELPIMMGLISFAAIVVCSVLALIFTTPEQRAKWPKSDDSNSSGTGSRKL